jgi:DNA-binding transcriptional MerR regulator
MYNYSSMHHYSEYDITKWLGIIHIFRKIGFTL